MGRHVKKNVVKVLVDNEDDAVLRECARLEKKVQRDPEIGSATVLRVYGMPAVRARLAELKLATAEPQPA